MEINLNNNLFWRELRVKPSEDLKTNLDEFYKLYQKVLIEMHGFPKDRQSAVRELNKKVVKDKGFLLQVFLEDLERGIPAPQISKIKEKDFDMKSLESYYRRLIRRLNKGDDRIRPYLRPEPYPIPFYRDNKVWFIVKRKSGKSIKQSKRKGIYDRYPEFLIIVTKKKGHWTLRTSFRNMGEKRVIQGVFNSKKIVLCKEDDIKRVFSNILDKSKMIEIMGEFSKDKKEYSYSFSSEEDINDIIEGDFKLIFENNHNLEKIGYLKFKENKRDISLKIIPHRFNVKHLKLVTSKLNPNQIAEISKILRDTYGIEEDLYIMKPEDKPLRMRFILDSNKIYETDLFILKEEIDYLKEKGLITFYYHNSFKLCLNKECFCSEDKELYEIDKKLCPNCDSILYKFGANCKVRRNMGKVRDYLIQTFKNSGLEYKGSLNKYFNRKKVSFHKFSYNDKEVLLYIHQEKGNLENLIEKFSERSLPVIVLTMKKDIAKKVSFEEYTAKKLIFTDVFIENEENDKIEISEDLEDLNIKKEKWRNKNISNSLTLLRKFSKTKDLNLFEGTRIQKKGNHFELLITHMLKVLSNAWIDLGQTFQNKSVPDGLGHLKHRNNSFTFGFDAKLKKDAKRVKGLTPKERERQVKYIEDFKKHSYGCGGLKNWIIVVKSDKDYDKLKTSITKLKKESGFDNIKLLSVEPLIKICEIYQKTLESNVVNKEIFDEFFYKLINYKGDITIDKINKIYSQIEEIKKLNIAL